jgi:hypothetical protein
VTDQRLRALERDAAHGDLQAQARLLLERVRVGDLTEERLRLAAYLGDEPARECVRFDVGHVSSSIEDLLNGVRLRDENLLPTVMIGVARTALDDPQKFSADTLEDCERVLTVTEAALREARPERLWEAARLADQVYNGPMVQPDFAARTLATAPAFLADGRIGAEPMCSFVSSAASFLGVSAERVRDGLLLRLLAPRGSAP